MGKIMKWTLTFNAQGCCGYSLAEYGLDFSGVFRFGHIDGETVYVALHQNLVLGAGLNFGVVDKPVHWEVLLGDLTLKDSKFILLHCEVLQGLREGKL